MKMKAISAFALLFCGVILLASPALAIEEEVRLKVINAQPYDMLIQTATFSGCELEEGFIQAPGDVPFDSTRAVSWEGECNVRLVWGIRFFSGITVSLTFDAETGEMKARSGSNEFFPVLSGPNCEDGVCRYRLLILNLEPWMGG